MNTPLSHFIPADPVAAQLGPQHGYAFDGDLVTLNAQICVVDPMAAASLRWVLQLWAEDTLVASADCSGLQTDHNGNAWVQITTDALLPAGTSEHAMTLTLASDDGSGLRRCDTAGYPRSERFCLPRIDGSVAYALSDAHTTLNADSIFNPRPADNLSGSLVLELWALPEPYRGGAFNGILIGSEALGQIAGQCAIGPIQATLPTCTLPAGRWLLTLMLREWTGHGYLTRDYRSFALAVDGPLPASAAVADSAVEFTASAPEGEVTETPVKTATASPAETATVPPTKAPAKAKTESKAKAASTEPTPKAAASKKVKVTSAAKASPAAAPAPAPSAKPAAADVSINEADAAVLGKLKGVTAAIAAGIVAGRPWKSIDDLSKVKGIGSKMLDRLRSQIRL